MTKLKGTIKVALLFSAPGGAGSLVTSFAGNVARFSDDPTAWSFVAGVSTFSFFCVTFATFQLIKVRRLHAAARRATLDADELGAPE